MRRLMSCVHRREMILSIACFPGTFLTSRWVMLIGEVACVRRVNGQERTWTVGMSNVPIGCPRVCNVILKRSAPPSESLGSGARHKRSCRMFGVFRKRARRSETSTRGVDHVSSSSSCSLHVFSYAEKVSQVWIRVRSRGLTAYIQTFSAYVVGDHGPTSCCLTGGKAPTARTSSSSSQRWSTIGGDWAKAFGHFHGIRLRGHSANFGRGYASDASQEVRYEGPWSTG